MDLRARLAAVDYSNTCTVALALAERGIAVFPVTLVLTDTKIDKIPAIGDWRHAATTDSGQIRAWFGQGIYVIGVPTGAINGFDALDIDPRNGGVVWLRDAEECLVDTKRHETISAGFHLLFEHHEGMRNSAGKIAKGVDIRGDGGYIVWWPGAGFPCTSDAIAPWQPWLVEIAMKGRARKLTGKVPLDVRKPPTARHAADLLGRMPNPLEADRDMYVDVMLAAKGCIDALTEAGELDEFDEEQRIIEAAVGWAERWEGGTGTDEMQKWDADWAHRERPLAGWQTLSRVAASLIPGYREEAAKEQFGGSVPPTKPYRGNPAWPNMLIRTKAGGIKANMLRNAVIALSYAPEWQGVLALNLFTGNVDLLSAPPYEDKDFKPRSLEDLDVSFAKGWLEAHYVDVSADLTIRAIKMVAKENQYHPVRDRLDGLTWDGVSRTDTWLIRHLGVEDTLLHRAISTRFLISLVARVRQPGCKVDTVPILEGVQGLLKSTVLEALVEPWFTDHMPDLAGKDAQLQLQGVWLVEFAEYGQLGRADANRAKNFVTIRNDRLRRPYERVVEEQPRQCVMAVTLNRPANGYLKDETGNRRFWPVLCGATWPKGQQIDVEAFRRERDQLLAEADHRWLAGEKWWLHEADLVLAHEVSVIDRVDAGPLYGQVAMALQSLIEKGVEEPSAHELRIAMGFGQSRPQDYREVGRVLTMLGYVGQRARRAGVRDTFYKKVKSE